MIFLYPGGRRLAIIGVTGRDDQDWPAFRQLLDKVAGSVSFVHHGLL